VTNNNKFSNWALIISAVRTPLGFFTLAMLILDGVLMITATSTEKISLLAPVVLLGFVIVFVFLIVWFKPELLHYAGDRQIIRVNVLFPKPDSSILKKYSEVDLVRVSLNAEQCLLEIRSKQGQIKYRGTPPNLALGYGSGVWTLELLEDIEPGDFVRLELVEHDGQRWRVDQFVPLSIEQKAIPDIQSEERYL
jgi:hypothetical protein